MISDRTIVALEGLFHDIGKFRQRARWTERKRHETHGSEWLQQEVVGRLQFLSDQERKQILQAVEGHHVERPYARDIRVVQIADRLASGERVPRPDEDGTGDPATELLLPVFRDIRLEGRGLGPEDQGRWAYATEPLALHDALFPRLKESLSADYPTLWQEFEQAWKALPDTAPTFTDPDAFVVSWLSLLRIYAWCVPAAAYKHEPDTSLADHLQVTGALAACLWDLPDDLLERLEQDAFRDEPVALLVGGDVTGIQRFLYTISSAGAAKSLRGRSAYLGLLCDAVAESVRRRLGLLPCNVLYSSGGHFFLLAPLTSESALSETKTEIERLLLDLFGGEVGIVLGSVKVLGSDLKLDPSKDKSPLGERWAELGQLLRRHKHALWRDVALQSPEQVFGPFGTGGPETYCVVCHSERDQPEGLRKRNLSRPVAATAEEAERKCSLCESFEDLSRRIARARYLTLRPVDPKTAGDLKWHSILTALGIELWLDDEDQIVERYRNGDWVFRINSPDLHPIVKGDRSVPVVGFRFLPNFTPIGPNGTIREMGELAHGSEGAPYYASLRMDVDSLGRIFSEGLGGRLSLSRMMTLSRSLTTFFEGYVNRVCDELDPERRHLYLLYSGGDDLFAVGSWDKVLGLVETLRDRFRQYTCRNPSLTLSGGTALHHEKFPLYQAAEAAGELVEEAKAWTRNGRTKDAFNLWGQAVEWEELGWMRGWHDCLRGWMEDKKLTRAFVFKLARIASMYEGGLKQLRREKQWSENDIRRRVRNDRWTWTLVYYLTKEPVELAPELERFQQQLLEDGRINRLRLLSRWVELSTRGRG